MGNRKAVSVIAVQIALVFIVVAIFLFGTVIQYIQEHQWLIYFGVLVVAFVLIAGYLQNQEEKKCKKCLSKNTTLQNSTENVIGWKYMTQKGLPDKRRKNNTTKYLATCSYKCNDCEHEFSIEKRYEK